MSYLWPSRRLIYLMNSQEIKVESLVIVKELETVEGLETVEELEQGQGVNLLMRSSAGGVARVAMLWPTAVAVSYK